MITLGQTENRELVRMVLEKYPVHLSAKAISRTILKETGKEVNIRAVVRSLEDIPVHVTQTTRRKYKLRPSSGTNLPGRS